MALPMELMPGGGLMPNQMLGNQKKGGFLSGLQDFFLGQPSRIEQFSNYTPWQQGAFNQITSSGLQNLQNPYQGFEPIKQQAISQFNQQTIPGLAERFTYLGNNATSSPSFASQLGQAGAGLSEGLAALQSQYGLQNRQQALSQLGLGLTPQYQGVQVPGSQGALGSLLPLLLSIGGAGLGSGLMGGGVQGAIGLLGALMGQKGGWDLYSSSINKK